VIEHRRLSGVERAWLVAAHLFPPFAIALVLEGKGELSAPAWSAALRRVDGSAWDGHSPMGAPFLSTSMDPRRGPTTEVLLVDGEPPRVVLRALHAAMDGRGLVLLAEDLLASLRGEPPLGAVAGPPTDHDLASELGRSPEPEPARDCPPPLDLVPGPERTWARARLEPTPDHLLPRVLVALGRLAQTRGGGAIRIDVPVDLRRHSPGLRSTANLTGLLRVDGGACLEAADPEARVAETLTVALDEGREADFVLAADPLRHLPLTAARWAAGRTSLDGRRTGRYRTCATVSNLGRLDLQALSGGGWATRRAFVIPPPSADLPLFLTLTGDERGVELCGAGPFLPESAAGWLAELVITMPQRGHGTP